MSQAEKLSELEEKLEKTIKQIRKEYGDQSISWGIPETMRNQKWVSSGILSFDAATQPHQGRGGIPIGKIVEVFGLEDTGKTSIALSVVKQVQQRNDLGSVAYLDNENSYNPVYASEIIGVDNDDLAFSQDSQGERTLDAIEALVVSDEFSLIVVDSVAGLVPVAEIKANMDDDQVAEAARMWNKATRKLKAALNRHDCTLFLINQLRDTVGNFGSSKVTTGGNALPYFADVRINVERRDAFTEGQGDDFTINGHRMRFRFEKNKVGTAWGVGFADLYYDSGFDETVDILRAGKETGVIEKAGGWRKYYPIGIDEDDDRAIVENGTDNFMEAIQNLEKPELMLQEIKERILGIREDEPLYYCNDVQSGNDNVNKNEEEEEDNE